jgi:glycine cleavage system regulatory protein
MTDKQGDLQHAALWLLGRDMPGILKLSAEYIALRGGSIEKDIADRFGEQAMVFLSVSAKPIDIARMDLDKKCLEQATGCGVVFQPTTLPTVPEGFQEDLFGFDILTDDTPGLIAELTGLIGNFGILIVGHTGERSATPGPTPLFQARQKFVLMLPHEFDRDEFSRVLDEFVKKHNGVLTTPLRPVLGLFWSWS